MAAYKDGFCEHFRTIFENLRYLSSEMRMRVIYGTFRLEEWKKNKEEYTKDEFEQTAKRAGVRGTCHMEKLIGNDQSATRLLQKILKSTDDFYPADARTPELKDVRPVHHLVIVIGGLQVEVEIVIVCGPTGKSWTPGPLRAYRREKQNRAISLVTASPQL